MNRNMVGGVSAGIVAGMAWLGAAGPARAQGEDIRAVARGNNAFAVDLYKQIKDSDKGNLFLSPYSISAALGMTYGGARENTAKQIAGTLHFTLERARLHAAFAALQARTEAIQETGNVQLNVANSLWPEKSYPFLDDYLALTKKYYGVAITPVDYKTAAEEARQSINAWVEDKTKNKIKDLIKPRMLDELTRLVLVNAIYFKGNWLTQFTKEATQEAPFYISADKTIHAPLMTYRPARGSRMPEFGYGEDQTVQVLDLPYEGNDLSMVVLLPKKRGGLAELENALTTANLENWTKSLPRQKVFVFLPKFKMTSEFSLKEALSALGMPEAFNLQKADFSGMDGNKPGGPHDYWLYIGLVLHKAFVEVNEEGTEAAAATAIVMRVGSVESPPPTPTFRADHPFLFLIRERQTGSILFMGRVMNPAA